MSPEKLEELLLSKKLNTDNLIEQTESRPQETLEFILKEYTECSLFETTLEEEY